MLRRNHEASKPAVIKLDPTGNPPEERREKVPVARRLYIRQKDLDDFGYTQNCPKCQHMIMHGNKVDNERDTHAYL